VPKDITFSEHLGGRPNYQLTLDDFPLHKLSNPDDRASVVERDTNDVISSQGVHYAIFVSAEGGREVIEPAPDPDGFEVGGLNVRRVEPRNTPTVINAVFNKLLFWDGRANDVFNGVNPSGAVNTLIYRATSPDQLTPFSVQLDKAPLASLAVGPPLSLFEMSAAGRPFREIGEKLLRTMKKKQRILARAGKKLRGVRPLAMQVIHSQDSVLAAESRSPFPGARTSNYDTLIRQAFQPEWWNSSLKIQLDAANNTTVLAGPPTAANEYTLMEWNFTLFFGLALQEYMATLIDGDTPFDRFQSGDTSALTEQQIRGLQLFFNSATAEAATAVNPGAGCNFCHTLPEFTSAARRLTEGTDASQGFRNIGVRPVSEDPGRLDGANPASGRFKVPTLRNVALTAPYMHNGGMATLDQVVEFYSRGRSDFDAAEGGAAPGTILNLSAQQKADLIAFMKALTDDRVRTKKAPFDHPSLWIPNGHPTNAQRLPFDDGEGNAVDGVVRIPAVGRNGRSSIAPQNFLGVQ
jgi:cytochrome c peroxidase